MRKKIGEDPNPSFTHAGLAIESLTICWRDSYFLPFVYTNSLLAYKWEKVF
jgi:hypothetical protein